MTTTAFPQTLTAFPAGDAIEVDRIQLNATRYGTRRWQAVSGAGADKVTFTLYPEDVTAIKRCGYPVSAFEQPQAFAYLPALTVILNGERRIVDVYAPDGEVTVVKLIDNHLDLDVPRPRQRATASQPASDAPAHPAYVDAVAAIKAGLALGAIDEPPLNDDDTERLLTPVSLPTVSTVREDYALAYRAYRYYVKHQFKASAFTAYEAQTDSLAPSVRANAERSRQTRARSTVPQSRALLDGLYTYYREHWRDCDDCGVLFYTRDSEAVCCLRCAGVRVDREWNSYMRFLLGG